LNSVVTKKYKLNYAVTRKYTLNSSVTRINEKVHTEFCSNE